MDGERFDGLAKAVANGVSRRRLLTGLAGSVVGVGLRGRSRAAGRMAYAQCEPEFGCAPSGPRTYAECEQQGGKVIERWSKCHAYRQSGGVSCGAFQYHWENICVTTWSDVTIDAGCGPCLF